MKKIIYGICGIGNGHFFRQKIIIDYFISLNYQILFFSYGEGLANLQIYSQYKNVKIVQVSVPYLLGDINGINFPKSLSLNNELDYSINLKAFSIAQEWIDEPDLVISDYEPISVQYGYSYNTKVITYDQQSKFLNDEIKIPGYSSKDEMMRLNMFFPKAIRIASSFFKTQSNKNALIIPPSYRNEIKNIKRKEEKNTFLIYLSSQYKLTTEIFNLIKLLSYRHEKFFIFNEQLFNNLIIQQQFNQLCKEKNISNIEICGKNNFEKILSKCEAVISNAGHNLLSECMFLKIPVYCLPLELYEQQLNAYIISNNSFGIQDDTINNQSLDFFTKNLDKFKENIKNDKEILFKKDGSHILLNKIKKFLD